MDEGRRTVGKLIADEAGRIDAVLTAALPDLSRARVQRLLADGHVTVNGELARKSDRVIAGDAIGVTFPEAAVHEEPVETPDLPVLFEDESFIAIAKPAGLVVHGGPGDLSPSVAGWFVSRYREAAAAFEVERPGIVHRLDKDTSGVLLLAKTPSAQAHASHSFEVRETEKVYLALVDGVPAQREAVIEANIGRHQGDRTKMAVVKRGRDARTGFEVIADDGQRALLKVRLYTGRTHQIRVHLAAVGTPVSGDKTYGSGSEGRQLLHAWRLAIPHPAGGRLGVTAAMPPDLAHAVRGMADDAVAFEFGRSAAELTPTDEDQQPA